MRSLVLITVCVFRKSVIKAMLEDEVVGFFALEEIKPVTRVAQYWIDTPYMRKGYGSEMFKYVKKFLMENNVIAITLLLDPIGLNFFKNRCAKFLDNVIHKNSNYFLYIFEFLII